MFDDKKILAIAPHIDDIELACGGTLSKLTRNNRNKVFYIAMSDCRTEYENSKFPPAAVLAESYKALQTLGIKKTHITILQHTVKHFYKESRSIFEKLEQLRNTLRPDIILIPSPQDSHEDHYIVARQAIIAFRRSTSIIAYEQPWNNFDFAANFYCELSKDDLKRKLKALQAYKSQYFLKRSYFSPDFITGLARTRGVQIDKMYAEAFAIIKLII